MTSDEIKELPPDSKITMFSDTLREEENDGRVRMINYNYRAYTAFDDLKNNGAHLCQQLRCGKFGYSLHRYSSL